MQAVGGAGALPLADGGPGHPHADAAPPAATPTPTPTAGAKAAPSSAAASARAALLDPSRATERAPERFRVRFETTKGPFVVEVTRAWAPRGADRFYNLVRAGYYDDVAFFRVIDGLHGPVRDPRRPQRQRRVAGGAHPRRPGHPVEPARDGDLRDGRTGHPDHPALHQLPGQPGPRRAGVRPLRPRRRGPLRRGLALLRLRRGRAPGQRARTRDARRARETPTCAGASRGWTSSRPPAW